MQVRSRGSLLYTLSPRAQDQCIGSQLSLPGRVGNKAGGFTNIQGLQEAFRKPFEPNLRKPAHVGDYLSVD